MNHKREILVLLILFFSIFNSSILFAEKEYIKLKPWDKFRLYQSSNKVPSKTLNVDFLKTELFSVFQIVSENSGINFLIEEGIGQLTFTAKLQDVAPAVIIAKVTKLYNLKSQNITNDLILISLPRN